MEEHLAEYFPQQLVETKKLDVWTELQILIDLWREIQMLLQLKKIISYHLLITEPVKC